MALRAAVVAVEEDQAVGGDHQEKNHLEGHRRGGMSAFAEEGNLAQQVAMPEDPEESLFPIDSAPHLDRALVH
jgi:hypothetical protein